MMLRAPWRPLGKLEKRYVSSTTETAVEQIEAVEAEEAGINIDFEVSTCSHMSLPIPLVLPYLPAEMLLQLHMALDVPVGVPTVGEEVSCLANGEEFPCLN
jgi:hypothetical protein